MKKRESKRVEGERVRECEEERGGESERLCVCESKDGSECVCECEKESRRVRVGLERESKSV